MRGRRTAVVAAVLVALALPASAAGHATLLSSTPAHETVVDSSPSQIVLRFSEPVRPEPGAVRVFDGVAEPVPIGKLQQPQPMEVVVPLTGKLERGSYTVVWRVISADLEPVNDFFVFHVGAGRGSDSDVGGASTGGGSDGPGPVMFVLAAVVLLGAAGLAFALRTKRRLRLVPVATGAVAAAALVVVGLGGDSGTSAAKAGTPWRSDVQMGELASRVSIAPAGVGANRIDLSLPKPTGAEGGYFEVRVRASLPAAGVGPFSFTGIQGDDPSQFSVRRAYLPLPGRWTLRFSARRGLEGRYSGEVTLPVGSVR
jgi:methionine-rich copper-binding protein CopC